MDKGIRAAAKPVFLELLPMRATDGNTKFRRTVMDKLMEQFGCSNAAAATHYNHAFKEVKKATPELVEGLGRAEDKKGGRKKKAAVEPAAAPVLLLTYTPAAAAEEVQQTEPKLHEVRRKSDDTVVATGLNFFAAMELVEKAKAAKKAKLYVV